MMDEILRILLQESSKEALGTAKSDEETRIITRSNQESECERSG